MRADPRRTRRRKALYMIAIVPSLLMLLVSARLFLLLHHDERGHAAYELTDYEGAHNEFAENLVLNPVERWKAPLNDGDARYRLADHEGAIEAFEVALGFAPSEWQCPIRVNLALAHEAAGDALLDHGDRPEAADEWLLGREAINSCTADPDAESDAETSTEDGSGTSAEDGSETSTEDGTDSSSESSLEDGSDSSSESSSEDASTTVPSPAEEVRVAAKHVDARLVRKLGVEPAGSRKTVDPADAGTKAKERVVEDRNKKAREERARNDDRPPPQSGHKADW